MIAAPVPEASRRKRRQYGRSTELTHSRVRQIETFFDPLQTVCDPIYTLGKFGHLDVDMSYFTLKRADALLDFAHIISQRIDRAADMTQMLENDVVHFGHA